MAGFMLQACERCWKRKQKCDRQRPSCWQCKAADKPCVERLMGNILDPSDPHTHHSYVESLRSKVRALEDRLESSPETSRSRAGGSDLSPQTASDDAQASEPTTGRRRHSTARPPNDSLQAEMGYLSLSAMAEFTWEQPSLTPNISFQTLLRASTGVSGENPHASDSPNAAASGPLGDFHRSLLRQGVSLTTTDTAKPFARFLDMCRTSLPLLSSHRLEQEYARVVRGHESGEAGAVAAESPSRTVRVYMAVAIGMLLCRDFRHMESFSTVLALSAQQCMPRVLAQATDLEAVQCLTLLTLFSMLSAFGGSTWHLLGLATTRCISAGMHNARVSDPESDEGSRRDNSRVFWNLFVLDAVISVSLDRPFSLQDDDITTVLAPSTAALDEESDDLRLWNVHHAKLLHDIRKHPSRGMLFHFSNYRHWKETAPPISPGHRFARLKQHHRLRSSCRVLLLILQAIVPVQWGRQDLAMAEYAEREFTSYLRLLEQLTGSQEYTPTSLDGLDIFSLGVGLAYVSFVRNKRSLPAAGFRQGVAGSMRNALGVLTTLRERFGPLRSLHAIFDRFTHAVMFLESSDDPWPELEAHILASEVPIPERVRTMIHSTLDFSRPVNVSDSNLVGI